jgi:spermidine synthase
VHLSANALRPDKLSASPRACNIQAKCLTKWGSGRRGVLFLEILRPARETGLMEPMSATRSRELFVLPLFFLSGASGLVYETLWVRAFASVFGSSVASAAMVTSIFMAGLGAGSYAAGILADRAHARGGRPPLVWYAWTELAVGCLGLAVAWTLPHLGGLSAALSSYVPCPRGWQELSLASGLARCAVAVALLAPVTLLLGATLTLLVRVLLDPGLERAGRRIGLLYGINTLGAAAGCLAVDSLIVPAVGISAASSVAAMLNLIAGLGALRLSAVIGRGPRTCAPPPPPGAPCPIGPAALAIFLGGFAGMGMEIVWLRFLSSGLGEFRFVFSLLVASILAGIWLGSTAAGWLESRLGHVRLLWGASMAGFVVSTIALMCAFDPETKRLVQLADGAGGLGVQAGEWLLLWRRLKATLSTVGLPSVFLGAAYPLANAMVQRESRAIGRRAGLLYLANTFGNVLGALAAGFALVPLLGTRTSVTILCAAAVASVAALAKGRAAEGRLGLAACGLVATAALVPWSLEPADYVPRKAFTAAERAMPIVALAEGVNETIAVIETPDHERALFTNGFLMTGTHATAQRYMRALAHLPLLAADEPRRVLVICFGVGNTLHAASLHPSVRELEVVDVSPDILSAARHFERWNRGVLRDPRVRVFVDDGRQHLRMGRGRPYDLITLEPPPLAFAGVSALYSREFYELAHSRLAPGGFISEWLPAYQVDAPAIRSIIRAFIDVFPGAVLLGGSGRHFILLGRRERAVEIDPVALGRRLRASPALLRDLRAIHLGSATEVVGVFAADHATLDRATRGAQPVTDDYPLLEFDSSRVLLGTEIPKEIFDTGRAASWCPGCFAGGRPVDDVLALPAYLAMLGALYRSDSFRLARDVRAPADRGMRLGLPRDAMIAALEGSAYLRSMFPGFLERLEEHHGKK